MVPIVYRPEYSITCFGLEKLHPFDGRKYARIHDWLIAQGLRQPADFSAPAEATPEELRSAHTAEYLESLQHSQVLHDILEVGVVAYMPVALTDWRVLQPMRYQVGGTLTAARLALDHGLSINLGGGFHHASGSSGGGFCVYADAPTALQLLHNQGRIRRALVIDTDAHQGDGTANALRDCPWAQVLDFYEDDIYPWPKVAESRPVPLPNGLPGPEYLEILREHVPRALAEVQPDILIYNAGSDVLADDPLTHLFLTPEDMAARDYYVVAEAHRRGVPTAMVLSGGYGTSSWEAHALSIASLIRHFDGVC